MARDAVIGLMKGGVENEKNVKNGYEFKDDDVNDIVDFIVEQISNTAKKLTGKDKQYRYSPVVMQMAYAMWSRSSGGYREMKAITPQCLPSDRQLRKIKQRNKVKDGEDIKVYQMRAAAKGTDFRAEYGYLMTDEMKLKHGVLWNTMTGEAVGIADDMLDLNAVLKRLVSDEGDVVKPAVYVNAWRYISIRADGTEGWMCGFFFNDGSLTGDTLLNQFDYVTLCCESIGSKVYGLVLDAGGNNAKFTRRLRNDVTFADEATWIDDDLCHTKNIFDPSRRIYFWFCMTHLLKAMRNQLVASQPQGNKAFLDKHGTSFGWAFILKLNQQLKGINNSQLTKDV